MIEPAEDGAVPSGHCHAANYHRSVVEQLEGDSLIVAMEHPNQKKLKPVVAEIGSRFLTLIKARTG